MAKAAKHTTTGGRAESTRYDDLKKMLEERRRELTNEVHGRLRDVRADSARERGQPTDEGEAAEVDIQDEIEFVLIQMKAEALNAFDLALNRLESGRYGFCYECGEEISEARLRALPFAVRCKDCEAARENAESQERALRQRRAATTLFANL